MRDYIHIYDSQTLYDAVEKFLPDSGFHIFKSDYDKLRIKIKDIVKKNYISPVPYNYTREFFLEVYSILDEGKAMTSNYFFDYAESKVLNGFYSTKIILLNIIDLVEIFLKNNEKKQIEYSSTLKEIERLKKEESQLSEQIQDKKTKSQLTKTRNLISKKSKYIEKNRSAATELRNVEFFLKTLTVSVTKLSMLAPAIQILFEQCIDWIKGKKNRVELRKRILQNFRVTYQLYIDCTDHKIEDGGMHKDFLNIK